ncbi:MAG: M20 family metallopeptidase [Phycisphaerales bacterium]
MRSAAATPALLACLAAAPLALAQHQVDEAVRAVTPEITALRHQIHQNPELSNREFKTAALVAEHLRSLGLEPETNIAHTGVVAVLEGGLPGPTIAVRADMDALPVTEETDFPFASTVRTTYNGQEVGVMHACGHDIHTSVQMGVASVLVGMRDRIPGRIVFIFQPAEEGAPVGEEGGAQLMLKEGVFEKHNPEVIFGLHTTADREVGHVAYSVGPALASVDHFRVTIFGRQAHGSRPEESIDPIVTASQFVDAVQTIRSRNLSPLAPSVVTVGIIRGGQRYNIIPESVYLEGTVRTYDEAVQDQVEMRMREILEGLTSAFGGSFEMAYDRYTPPTINSPDLTAQMVPTIERVLGASNVHEQNPIMGGEDFAYFAREVPGFFYFLGTREPGGESGGAHTPTFRAVDESIPVGITVMTNVLLDYLHSATN